MTFALLVFIGLAVFAAWLDHSATRPPSHTHPHADLLYRQANAQRETTTRGERKRPSATDRLLAADILDSFDPSYYTTDKGFSPESETS